MKDINEIEELALKLALEIIAEARGCRWACVSTARSLIAMLCPCADCNGLHECKVCEKCLNREDSICNACPLDVSKCKWYSMLAAREEKQ